VLSYRADLKQKARGLRKNLTDSERVLWSRVRGKQVLGVQFYRQKPIGDYLVDFYAPKAKLVIEIDGSQHLEEDAVRKDRFRDKYLGEAGLRVIRFNSRQVLEETEAVLEVIYQTIKACAESCPSRLKG
jgi:very-short-patch-repair endonuclease